MTNICISARNIYDNEAGDEIICDLQCQEEEVQDSALSWNIMDWTAVKQSTSAVSCSSPMHCISVHYALKHFQNALTPHIWHHIKSSASENMSRGMWRWFSLLLWENDCALNYVTLSCNWRAQDWNSEKHFKCSFSDGGLYCTVCCNEVLCSTVPYNAPPPLVGTKSQIFPKIQFEGFLKSEVRFCCKRVTSAAWLQLAQWRKVGWYISLQSAVWLHLARCKVDLCIEVVCNLKYICYICCVTAPWIIASRPIVLLHIPDLSQLFLSMVSKFFTFINIIFHLLLPYSDSISWKSCAVHILNLTPF